MMTRRMPSLARFLVLPVLTGCLLGGVPGQAFAQNEKVAALAAANEDAAIQPYIDEGTFIVARLDLERVDPEKVAEYMQTTFESLSGIMGVPEDQKAMVKQQFTHMSTSAKTWLTDMTQAGAKQVYVLVDQADQTGDREHGPVVVVPLVEGADSEKIQSLFSSPSPRMRIAEIGKAVVFAESDPVERIKTRIESNAAPVDHPDLAAAFATAGDAPLRVAFVPSESTRAWIEQNLPQLPEVLGGGETKILSRGIRYALVSAVQKPAVKAQLTIRANDEAAAKALHDVATKGKAYITQMTASAPDSATWAKQMENMQPKLAGDKIEVSFDPAMFLVGSRFAVSPGSNAAPAPNAKPDDGGL